MVPGATQQKLWTEESGNVVYGKDTSGLEEVWRDAMMAR